MPTNNLNHDLVSLICSHSPIQTLLSLSLVSHPIHELTLPHIYTSISLTSHRNQLPLLHSSLLSNPNLRKYVQHLHIDGTRVIPNLSFRIPSWVYGDGVENVECLSRVVLLLQRLKVLDVEGVFCWNMCLADPYFVWAVNEVLEEKRGGKVICYSRPVQLELLTSPLPTTGTEERKLLMPVSLPSATSKMPRELEHYSKGCTHCCVQDTVRASVEQIDFDRTKLEERVFPLYPPVSSDRSVATALLLTPLNLLSTAWSSISQWVFPTTPSSIEKDSI